MNINETLLFVFFIIVIIAFIFKSLTGFKNVRSLFLSKTKQNELDIFLESTLIIIINYQIKIKNVLFLEHTV